MVKWLKVLRLVAKQVIACFGIWLRSKTWSINVFFIIIVILQKFNRAQRYLDSVGLWSHPSACHVVTVDNFLCFRAKFHLQTPCMSNELESNKYFFSSTNTNTAIFNTFGMSPKADHLLLLCSLEQKPPRGSKDASRAVLPAGECGQSVL